MYTTFCENCNNLVDIKIVDNQKLHHPIYDVDYLGKRSFCIHCNEEVFNDEIVSDNDDIAKEVFKNSIITKQEIEELLEKYNIGATVLCKLMGWSDVTITRYLNGSQPSKSYSDQLKHLYDSPVYLKQLLENKKEQISAIAYKKSMSAIANILLHDELALSLDIKETNIDVAEEQYNIDIIANYILSKRSVTPKALQKILYYSQGFYNAFYNSWLFNETPEAWVHGPVYKHIYKKYNSFKYEPITIFDENIINNLNNDDKTFLNCIIKCYGCYTGDILEEVTHLELPWIKARKGISKTASSSNKILKEDINKYFINVKDNYNMYNYFDTKKYIECMINQL
ncbi:MAG: type II toxin-antitoxin system antitoxin SocA domain-containing protein [Clostridium paraputrificum]|uniref:type II toxin-antitoxin system antitoxin SocA domain-containing protein n=1 Tax=Clostridium sp. TaxID=1506 RepID=UPI0025BDE6AA|nr:type II toxin-antitoxin system antitoxin SocA domain-containing protein [Clostridium sp.]MBS5926127.1 DUF4065 domain-containing protein [Clostridium sp.]